MTQEELLNRLLAGEVDTAVEAFLAVNPDISLFGVAMGLANSEYLAVAESVARYYHQKHPESPDALIVLARVLGRQGRFDEMLEACHAMIGLDTAAASTYRHICTLLVSTGQIEALYEIVRLAKRNIPEEYFLDFQPGWLLPGLLHVVGESEGFALRAAKRRADVLEARQFGIPLRPQASSSVSKELLVPTLAVSGGFNEIGTGGEPSSDRWRQTAPLPTIVSNLARHPTSWIRRRPGNRCQGR